MSYQHLITRLLRSLEEDIVITNPKDRSRAFLRKLTYQSATLLDKVRRLIRGRGKQR
jgi:hypothetical protein